MAEPIERLAPRVRQMRARLDRAARQGVLRAGQVVAREAERHITIASGGDMKLSGMGGARLGVRVRPDGSRPRVTVSVGGPIHILDAPTRPHVIPSRRGKKLSVVPGVGPRARVEHPGTRGKRSWNRALDEAQPKIRPVFREEVQRAMRGT